MRIRLITAIVALIVFIPLVLFSNTWVFPAAMGICTAIGIFEMIRCIGQKKNFFLIIPLCALGLFFPIYVRYSGGLLNILSMGVAILILASIYVFAVAVFGNKTLKVTDAGLLLAVFVYVTAGFSSTVYLRDLNNGVYLLYLPFISGWITDSFAYFTGRLFGKHKLIPSVSPKKTVEGAIGGTIFGAASIVLFAFVVANLIDGEGGIRANYLAFAVLGLIIPIISQIGDLIMSVIKRHYQIKDYGKFFPGHGGMLDRFDSSIAVSLIMAIACTYIEFFPNVV
jgi:phosphatidate cytidylyltransferase